ncbi:porin family protein [Thiotrichales bacterium 19S11-10]|nr:porin family protein [Thiotrichales bacterium 19S11-10]MCF6806844.1 porin family protein [Thiotrichales bacterium 19S9-11]MCF6810813.1 porin family protein [Thiotrichales bacterium 19S9-12]
MIKRLSYLLFLFTLFSNAWAIGPYIDINGGYTFSGPNTISNAVNQKDGGLGYNLNVGWMIVPIVGVEAGFINYPDVTYRYNATNQSASLSSYNIAVKGDAPLPMDGLSLIGKLGIGRLNQGSLDFTNNKIDKKHNNNLFWGLGFKYKLAHGFYSVIQYQVNQGEGLPSSALLSFGLGFEL